MNNEVAVKQSFKIPFYIQTILAMFLGLACGVFAPTLAKQLEPITQSLIWLIKMLAMPLLYLAIADTVAQAQFGTKGVFQLAVVSIFNSFLAVIIALGITNLLQPGKHLPLTALAVAGNVKSLKELSVGDALVSFITSGMVLVIIAALISGVLLQRAPDKIQK